MSKVPLEQDMYDESGALSTVWHMWFDQLETDISDGVFSSVTAGDTSGTAQSIDSWDAASGNYAFIIYTIKNSTNIRSGILMIHWDDSGTLPTRPTPLDARHLGDTSDASFTATYEGSKIYLKLTSTNTYTYKSKRLVI